MLKVLLVAVLAFGLFYFTCDTAAEITAILQKSAHAFGKCVVVVTHAAEVAKQADTVLEIKRGRLKEREAATC